MCVGVRTRVRLYVTNSALNEPSAAREVVPYVVAGNMHASQETHRVLSACHSPGWLSSDSRRLNSRDGQADHGWPARRANAPSFPEPGRDGRSQVRRPSDRRGPGSERSRCRCSMCPAIHINSRSWLRSSSTHESSDPPHRVVLLHYSTGQLSSPQQGRRPASRDRAYTLKK